MGRIGTSELLVIFIIALVIFGPKQLPELGRMLGKAIGSLKHYADSNTWAEEAEKEESRKAAEKTVQVSEAVPAAAGEPAPVQSAEIRNAVTETVAIPKAEAESKTEIGDAC